MASSKKVSRQTKQVVKKSVVVSLSLSPESFSRLAEYKKAKGLLTEQDVLRLAANFFLDNQGY